MTDRELLEMFDSWISDADAGIAAEDDVIENMRSTLRKRLRPVNGSQNVTLACIIRTAHFLSQGATSINDSEYLRGQVELITDLAEGLTQDDKEIIEALVLCMDSTVGKSIWS